MSAGQAAAAKIGAKGVTRVLERLEESARGALPRDVAVTREVGAVVLSGARLRARMFEDARLRDFALLAKGSHG